MLEGTRSTRRSTIQLLTSAAVLTILVVAAATFSSTSQSVSSQSKAVATEVQSAGDLIVRVPRILGGVATDGTKVTVSSAAAAALRNICSVLRVTIVVLPAYFNTTTAGETISPLPNASAPPVTHLASGSSVDVIPGAVRIPRYQQPVAHDSFCVSYVSSRNSKAFGYVIPKGAKAIPLATIEIAKSNDSYWTLAARSLRDSFWLPAAVFILLALGLGRLLLQTRKETFGLSTAELRSLLQEQEALLKGISEGVIGCDHDGRVRFFNSEARRLLGLPENSIDRPLRHVVRGKRLRQVLVGEIPGRDLPVVVGRSILSISRLGIEREGMNLGHVITIQDRTEWEGLMRELDGMVGMTEALRAQAHEFSNKIHTIVGLIELGEVEEAISFAINVSSRRGNVHERVESISDQMLKALILAKGAVASEKGVELLLSEESALLGSLRNPLDILTVIGNLIDNALDAVLEAFKADSPAACHPAPMWIELTLRSSNEDLYIEVTDSGGGIDAEILPSIFTDGFSTKVSAGGYRRGLGLALISQIVAKYNGVIKVSNRPGASFSIELPGVIELDFDERTEIAALGDDGEVFSGAST